MKTFITILFAIISLAGYGQCYNGIDQTDTAKGLLTLNEYRLTGKIPPTTEDNGYFMSFWATKQIAQEGELINGKKNGIWIRYYENGKIEAIISYWDDMEDGIKKLYYENGNIRLEGYTFRKEKPQYEEKQEYNKATKDSLVYVYLLNGDGYKDGKWNEYNEQGRLIKTTTYDMGKAIATKEY